MKTKYQTAQQIEWRTFSDAMNSDRNRAKKLFATLIDEGNRDAARRWLFGANSSERAESASRQLAINDTKSISREIDFMTSGVGFLGNDAL